MQFGCRSTCWISASSDTFLKQLTEYNRNNSQSDELYGMTAYNTSLHHWIVNHVDYRMWKPSETWSGGRVLRAQDKESGSIPLHPLPLHPTPSNPAILTYPSVSLITAHETHTQTQNEFFIRCHYLCLGGSQRIVVDHCGMLRNRRSMDPMMANLLMACLSNRL